MKASRESRTPTYSHWMHLVIETKGASPIKALMWFVLSLEGIPRNKTKGSLEEVLCSQSAMFGTIHERGDSVSLVAHSSPRWDGRRF